MKRDETRASLLDQYQDLLAQLNDLKETWGEMGWTRVQFERARIDIILEMKQIEKALAA